MGAGLTRDEEGKVTRDALFVLFGPIIDSSLFLFLFPLALLVDDGSPAVPFFFILREWEMESGRKPDVPSVSHRQSGSRKKKNCFPSPRQTHRFLMLT